MRQGFTLKLSRINICMIALSWSLCIVMLFESEYCLISCIGSSAHFLYRRIGSFLELPHHHVSMESSFKLFVYNNNQMLIFLAFLFQLGTSALCEEIIEPVRQVEDGEDEWKDEPGDDVNALRPWRELGHQTSWPEKIDYRFGRAAQQLWITVVVV